MQSVEDIFSFTNLPKIIDISALSPATTVEEVRHIAVAANKYGFIAAFVLPCYVEFLSSELGDNTNVILGATIGFPTGADLTRDKVLQVMEMKKLGCREFDMVINIGMLKSCEYRYVKNDIENVVLAADGLPVKVILEVTYLQDDEIRIGSEMVASAGASYVKTGTGYSKPTLVRHIEIIKKAVGDRISIKCAGGVKNLEQLKDMYSAGATRFGIGIRSALDILYSTRCTDKNEIKPPYPDSNVY